MREKEARPSVCLKGNRGFGLNFLVEPQWAMTDFEKVLGIAGLWFLVGKQLQPLASFVGCLQERVKSSTR
jgi:hypothetical protein